MLARRPLPNADLHLSDIGMGTASVGTQDADVFDQLMKIYRDAGGNFIDTAHCYSFWTANGAGASECAVGNYLQRNGGRDELILCTKGGHPSAPGYRAVDRFLSAERIRCDIDDSLGRLRVDTIDLYWLHRDDPREPVGPVIDCLNAEIGRGRIRYIAVSHWQPARIEAANAYAKANGLHGFVAQQPQWSLAERNGSFDPTMISIGPAEHAWHVKHAFPMFPWNSTAKGYFATNGERGAKDFDNPTSRRRLAAVQALANELGVTPNQVALRYLIDQPFPCFPLTGTKNPDHLRDTLGVGSFRLTPEQCQSLL